MEQSAGASGWTPARELQLDNRSTAKFVTVALVELQSATLPRRWVGEDEQMKWPVQTRRKGDRPYSP